MKPGRAARRPRYTVAALERGLDVLDALAAAGEATLAGAAAQVRMPKTTVFRLLATLEARGFVERSADGAYRPGLRLVGLARSAEAATDLRRVAGPYLERLHRVSGDTVNLAVWRGRAVVYLEVLPSPRPLRFVEAPGSRAPLHATALGKAIAAHLPRAEVAAVVRASGLPRFTARTVTSLPRLFLELRRVRARGYAVDREEQAAGAVCVAAPVFDRGGIAGAVSIAAPAARLDARRLERLIPELAAACGRISHRLGHRATGEEARRLAAGSAAAGGVGLGT